MKYLVSFLAGVAVGAVGTMFWLQKDYKKKLDELKNMPSEQGESMENPEKDGKKETGKEEKTASEDPEIRRPEDGKRVLMGKTDLYGYTNYSTNEGHEREIEDRKRENDAENEQKMVDYASLYDENVTKSGAKSDALTDKSDAWDEEDDEFDVEERVKETEYGPPYEISEFEYLDNAENYAKKEIKYYAGNDVFCDENDECVTFLAQCVTFDNQKWRMEIEKNEPEKVWVKNDQIGVLYEVWIVYDSYSEG